ncbi:hypothetical protein MRB53_015660 [Persea americana]|uniref:Uncharacterized protein n=1 Tax=Persea americana TaxID=3435 RepID=A0ACC2LZN9_PERAE|nr:hypothetical protein MRB53_015660 [Persea americana]
MTQALMGFKSNLGLWVFLFFFLISSFPALSLSQKIDGNDQQEVNTRSYSLNEELKKKNIKAMDSRPFTAMLPRGFVPPSGSSSCHNDIPNSMDFYCDESTTNP